MPGREESSAGTSARPGGASPEVAAVPRGGRFVEAFASAFYEAGVPRMPSRVFAALLASESGRLTAAELSERLQASAAAISGAVRYLVQVELVVREREPGTRRDVFVVGDNAWYEAIVRRERLLAQWQRVLRDGVEEVGRDSAAGARLAETVEFFEFLEEEMPALLERWRARRSG